MPDAPALAKDPEVLIFRKLLPATVLPIVIDDPKFKSAYELIELNVLLVIAPV